MERPALLDKKQQDRALRNLMPIVEWLTNADSAMANGMLNGAQGHMHAAVTALRRVPPNRPAIKAYMRWLEQNTELGIEPSAAFALGLKLAR